MNLEHNTSNSESMLKPIMDKAREFGRDAAAGGDALPKLGLLVLDAAEKGIINDDRDQVTGKDDIDRIYDEYTKSYGKKVQYDAAGVKANASKLRQIARMAMAAGSKYDPIEAVESMKNIRESALAREEKVKGMYPCLVELSRAQLKLDRQITNEEIEGIVLKKEAEIKPVDEVLGKLRETVEKIITGEHKSGQCKDPRVVAAHDSLRDYLAGIEQTQKEVEEEQLLAAIMAKRGVKLVPVDEQVAA